MQKPCEIDARMRFTAAKTCFSSKFATIFHFFQKRYDGDAKDADDGNAWNDARDDAWNVLFSK